MNVFKSVNETYVNRIKEKNVLISQMQKKASDYIFQSVFMESLSTLEIEIFLTDKGNQEKSYSQHIHWRYTDFLEKL